MTLVFRESDAACLQREPAALAPAWSALAAQRQPSSKWHLGAHDRWLGRLDAERS